MNKAYNQYLTTTFLVSFAMLMLYKLTTGNLTIGIVYAFCMLTCVVTGRWLVVQAIKKKDS